MSSNNYVSMNSKSKTTTLKQKKFLKFMKAKLSLDNNNYDNNENTSKLASKIKKLKYKSEKGIKKIPKNILLKMNEIYLNKLKSHDKLTIPEHYFLYKRKINHKYNRDTRMDYMYKSIDRDFRSLCLQILDVWWEREVNMNTENNDYNSVIKQLKNKEAFSNVLTKFPEEFRWETIVNRLKYIINKEKDKSEEKNVDINYANTSDNDVKKILEKLYAKILMNFTIIQYEHTLGSKKSSHHDMNENGEVMI